jgi:hypothetical protein
MWVLIFSFTFFCLIPMVYMGCKPSDMKHFVNLDEILAVKSKNHGSSEWTPCECRRFAGDFVTELYPIGPIV